VVDGAGLVPFAPEGETDLTTTIPENKHRQILQTCIDVPETSPSFPLPIKKVGISGKTVWVRLAANNSGHIPFRARILISLAADRRGIHMSRMEQAISLLHDKEFADLTEYGKMLGHHIMKTQNAQHLSLELTGHLPYLQEAPVSKLRSVDAFEASFNVIFKKNKDVDAVKTQVGAGIYHLTACPCTLAYNETLFDRFNDPWPQATHSQRSKTRLLIGSTDDGNLPSYSDLTEILDSVLHISHDLLKRPDETELVLKAHRNPQFAEDTVREVARAAGEKFNGILPQETQVQVHSLSLESIHIHDVECFIDTSLGEILVTLQSIKQE
jgi:GTP cyclohydrolase FolE2